MLARTTLNVADWWAHVIYHEILTTAKCRRGEPPRDQTQFRRYVVGICVNRDQKGLRHLLDLSVLPNGSWKDDTVVEFYIPVDADVDEDSLKVMVASRTTRALVPGLYGIVRKDCMCDWVIE